MARRPASLSGARPSKGRARSPAPAPTGKRGTRTPAPPPSSKRGARRRGGEHPGQRAFARLRHRLGGLRLPAPPSVRITLAAGLAIVAVAFVLTLSHSPLTVARGNVSTAGGLVTTSLPARACQGEEALPRGTSAIRLALLTVLGPEVTVRVLSGSRVVTQGSYPPGWSSGAVTVPVTPVARAVAPVKVCFALSSMNAPVTLRGWTTRRGVAAVSSEGPLPGRMGVEYLRPSHQWWSSAAAVIRRLGYGHAASGLWDALLVVALALAFIALTSWLVLKELS